MGTDDWCKMYLLLLASTDLDHLLSITNIEDINFFLFFIDILGTDKKQ